MQFFLRVLEMLENIIRVPIFYQSAVYALQLAIFLYVIEVVRIFKLLSSNLGENYY